ncbi:1114_t:CDS:2, partial [Gigaspora margarita]
ITLSLHINTTTMENSQIAIQSPDYASLETISELYQSINSVPDASAKEKLPNTSQMLNSATKHLFLYTPKDRSELRFLVEKLREYYFFKKLLNDYFLPCQILPIDPKM